MCILCNFRENSEPLSSTEHLTFLFLVLLLLLAVALSVERLSEDIVLQETADLICLLTYPVQPGRLLLNVLLLAMTLTLDVTLKVTLTWTHVHFVIGLYGSPLASTSQNETVSRVRED